MTPIEANALTATTSPQEVLFSSPLKSLSIVNSGPSGVKFWSENSNPHTLNSGEGLDFDSEYGINSVYLQSLGTSNVRFVGVKKQIQTSEQAKIVPIPQANQPVSIPVIKADGFNLNFGLIVLAIIAVLGIVAIAIAYRK